MSEVEIRPQPRLYYIAFPSVDAGSPLTLAAQLRIPPVEPPMPAVVIVHGSAGVDSRGIRYAQALNDAGIASFEIDMWSPRLLLGGSDERGRPAAVVETLPDAFGALVYLASRPEIDIDRVGIMGFSWGGIVSMLTAVQRQRDHFLGDRPLRFAAHAPFYPVCWTFGEVPDHSLEGLTGAPILIQTGADDDYDEPDSCPRLVASLPPAAQELIEVVVYPEATHAFDRLEPAFIGLDPYSHLGRGGEVRMAPNPAAAEAARSRTVAFFRRTLAAG